MKTQFSKFLSRLKEMFNLHLKDYSHEEKKIQGKKINNKNQIIWLNG